MNERFLYIKQINIFELTLIILSIFGLAAFSFFGIDNSMWLDEAYSVYVSNQNFAGIITNLKIDTGPPLYYMLLALWIKIFGISEVAVRSLSSTLYMATLFSIYLLAKMLFENRRAGLLSSFLYMLSPLAFIHAQNARMYSLLTLLVTLSLFFFSRLYLVKHDSKRDYFFYILINILGTFTHYWFFFFLLSQVLGYIFLFLKYSPGKFIIAILISTTPFLILWSPIVILQMSTNSTVWMDRPGIEKLIASVLGFWGFRENEEKALVIYALFLILLLFKVDGSRIRLQDLSTIKEFLAQRKIVTLLILATASLLVPFVISQLKPIYVTHRGPIIALPPFVIFIGALLSRFGNRTILLAVSYLLLIYFSLTAIAMRSDPIKERYSDKTTASYIIRNSVHKDILVFTSLSRASIDYYLQLEEQNKKFIEFSFPLEMASHLGWRNEGKMWSERYKLEKEANDLMVQLDELIGENNNIWLFYGYDLQIGKILKSKLDKKFTFTGIFDLRGSYYDKVIQYRKQGSTLNSGLHFNNRRQN
jgi:mannosyltransferase